MKLRWFNFLNANLVFFAFVGRFLRDPDDVGQGVDVEDGALTGIPDPDSSEKIKIDNLKVKPGVSALRFSLLTTRAVEGGGAGTGGETIAAAGLK